MDYFPLFAELTAQPCLVVGGGPVAERKTRELLAAGAAVTVNAPALCPALAGRLQAGGIRHHEGPFEPALVPAHLLIIAATSERDTNRAVAAAARDARRLCNIVDDGAASTFIVPAIVDRSPLIVAISSGGRAPLLARRIRQQLERWLPARLGALATWAGNWRERVHARLPGSGTRRAFWESLFAGPAARAALAGAMRDADEHAEALLAGIGSNAPAGRAWLVGAGPGDPGLISVCGLDILQSADVVLHDRLVSADLLRFARKEAEIICVGKTGGGPSTRQEDINRLLVDRVRAGQRVCRLKGGDPLIFGRGGEEAQALAAAGLEFEIIPGITAASGASASARMPLTHRGLSGAVTLVTARPSAGEPEPRWAELAGMRHTLVVYMGGAQVAVIAGELVRHGRSPATAAALVVGGTLPEEVVVTGTLADIGERASTLRALSPALLVVGETVALAADLDARGVPDFLESGVLPGARSYA